jgi:hypothetical protein
MARLSESQLAGFRTGGTDQAGHVRSRQPKTPAERAIPNTEQPTLTLQTGETTGPNSLGPVPAAPTRSEPRHKVGLTLPLELAEQVRELTRQGYALADLVMVAYEHHRDELLSEHQTLTTRRLQRRTRGRSGFTITLSADELDALDHLARHLDTTRSQTIAALLQRQLSETDAAREFAAPHTGRNSQ